MKSKGIFFFIALPGLVLVSVIRVYQKLFSPDHSFWAKTANPGGYCKYTPSCSEYAVLSIQKYGAVRGGVKFVWRILRCNPWSRGGIDLP